MEDKKLALLWKQVEISDKKHPPQIPKLKLENTIHNHEVPESGSKEKEDSLAR